MHIFQHRENDTGDGVPAWHCFRFRSHYDYDESHWLTFSCYRRLPLLSKDQSRQWFVEAMKDARKSHGFHLWAWVIMPEHVHVAGWHCQ